MPQKSFLYQSPPFAVEDAIRGLGANLKTARLRRGLTLAEAAERIGAGVRAVRDAENGKPTTSASVYIALLWLYGLLTDLYGVANPSEDAEGLRLATSREPQRARASKRGIDNDF